MNSFQFEVERAVEVFQRLERSERVGFNALEVFQRRHLQSFQIVETDERLVV